LGTEGISDGGSSVEWHGGGWFEVESSNGGLGVRLISNIFDAEDISGFGTILLHLEGDRRNVSSDTFTARTGSSRVSVSTGSISRITSITRGSHFSNSRSTGRPFLGFTGEITFSTVDFSGGSS